MLREEESYGLCEIIAVEKICCIANALNELNVDGVVLGFLRAGGVDLELTAKVLACAPNLKATFHHAFEDTADKHAAIRKLKTLPQIDKILSHGGNVSLNSKVANLAEYATAAAPEIEILAGGGVNAEVIRIVRETTPIREFHVGTAARNSGRVDVSRVKELVTALSQNYV
jgi:copper homeostasis protein